MEEKEVTNSNSNQEERRFNKQNRYKRHKKNLQRQLKNSENSDENTKKTNENADKNSAPIDTAKKKKRHSKKNTVNIKLNGNEEWQVNINSAVESNLAMHDLRLNPLKYYNNTQNTIRITPLGGLGEIGANMTVFETDTSAIIVDVGMSFPDENMLGVDILIPDFDYIRKIKNKIKGIIITHAHEDHIGAMPYFFKEFKFPIYATPLPLGMISNKFDEHGLKAEKSYFRPVEKRKIYEIGDFSIEFIHITHSIIDASALAITTKAGTIIHTGDFKIDHTPIDGYPTDLNRLAYYGEKGVLLLMSDSTNSHKEGFTKSESSVGNTFDDIFSKSKGRVIMSTFSSNIHRVYQAIERGLKYNRKICVIGRSMERNLFTAMQLNYIKVDKKYFIDADEVVKYPDNEVLIVTTGSQGETMSALYRMATDEHKYIKIKPSDQIIISAKAIPGNESSVSTVLNYLLKSGASVAYQDFSEIHVSGHAAKEEQKLMIRLIKPKFFLPVHGEYNHIVKHKETAISCGINEANIYLMNDGDQMEVCGKYLKRVKTVKTGKVFIDNQINKQISDNVVMDRQNLADAGVVIIIAQIDKSQRKLIKTRVMNYGLTNDKQNSNLTKEMEETLIQFLSNVKDEAMSDQKMLENQIRQVVRKHIFRKTKKYPIIVPVIYLM
ncbi:metallo-beta-lactamase family protein [Campylobacter sputorum subsp. bubulus]|uniref:Ribonuclease J n=1 Tax=Campylobacter sputorum subsp. sputorum TaxID=32024 RepID=A0A381DK21_9BACT|nr:ribonuclease J [Campylobacter sputorum]ASM34356.1 mRNA degradation ribonuclease J1/J2 (metallo-beta-lactamase superfamily) [Campylobacter sputorum aubsp. sputorum RM3237]KAB0582253.1 ribonuclease J [Campylobacter sputorum subsp. sputorum]QEL04547.1 mRNA degradation ribonuclease J1/J2 (metallo-beta-lactamase superfamily) [Campylobacter sputorum subsp. sputorum]SUX09323.1 metallo-beta-lactamase family protein [Campylobacter sputorum subsp. bubulus]SUX11016.1 metallo-beta-lactamase family prot